MFLLLLRPIVTKHIHSLKAIRILPTRRLPRRTRTHNQRQEMLGAASRMHSIAIRPTSPLGELLFPHLIIHHHRRLGNNLTPLFILLLELLTPHCAEHPKVMERSEPRANDCDILRPQRLERATDSVGFRWRF